MHETTQLHARRRARRFAFGTRSSRPRALATTALTLLAAAAALLFPVSALADTGSSLTVVGTSDVADSGLMANVIQPAFQAAYPAITFKYIGTATGTAIADAESGAQGPSVLMVHAPTLENQFVAGGYSNERFGRAIFRNDFVLAGATADPAGVMAGAPHNIAQAFADVATAGIAGHATFVSRGGTPGTTVEEHKLWALVDSSGLAPSGLLLCAVNATSGGGETPIAAGNGVTANGQACPNSGALPTSGELPAWYVTTGLTQGPNVIAANACTGYPSGANSCYVLTDRGTYDYLASGTDPAGSIPGLEIVTRDDTASAPGGAYELINYFHAYAINPSKPGETVNLTAAMNFLNMLTSPTMQAQIKTYLAHTSDPGGAPFVPDASPLLTASTLPKTYHAGKPITVTGTLTNAEIGYPVLSGKTVSVDEVVGGLTVPIASGRTSATGSYSIKFVPPATGSYELVTPQILQVENATLSPIFGDLLSPAATTAGKITVVSAVTALHVKSEGGRALVYGSVAPGTGHVHATVTVFARKGKHGKFKKVGSGKLGTSDGNFAVLTRLGVGTWQVKVAYKDPKQVVGTTSKVVSVTIGAAGSTRVAISSVAVGRGGVTVKARLAPAPTAGGGVLKLLALRLSAGSGGFAVVAIAKFKAHKTNPNMSPILKPIVHAKLKSGVRYVLQLEYVPKGQAPSWSGLGTVKIG